MKARTFSFLTIAMNGLLFVGSIIFFVISLVEKGGLAFRSFAMDTSLLAGIVSLIYIVMVIRSLREEKEIPQVLDGLRLIFTTALVLNAISAVAYLGPIKGYSTVYEGWNFLPFIVIPLFSLVSFLLFESRTLPRARASLFSTSCVLAYAFYYIINLGLHVEIKAEYDANDWYGFGRWGLFPQGLLVLVIMLYITFFIGFLLFFLRRSLHMVLFYEEEEDVDLTELSEDEYRSEDGDDYHDEGEEEVVEIISDTIVKENEGENNQEETSEEGVFTEQYKTKTGTLHAVKKRITKKKETKKYKDTARVYHVSQHILGWQVKLAKGEKVIKTFKTQKEAIEYAKSLVKTNGGSIRVHSMKGSIRKAN